MKGPLQGVNLGGWLIVEKWMTPSLFVASNAKDEFTLSQTDEGRKAIKKHRDTFIQEEDFIWMHRNGVQAIRLPVGYWALHGGSPYIEQLKYIDWTFEMALKYDLEVVLDVHALQGSQNGNDHSGKIGRSEWFTNTAFREESLHSVIEIAKRYKDHPKLWGYQIINEPKFGIFHLKLRQYYRNAYDQLIHILHPGTRLIFSDGYTPRLLSNAMWYSKRPVTMDIHLYHFAKSWTRISSLKAYYSYLLFQKRLLKRLSRAQPIIIGEWSGVFLQKIFDKHPTPEHGGLIKEHVKRQIDSFCHTEAWFYWNYKTEKPGVWDFRSQVEAGIIELERPAYNKKHERTHES